MKISDEAVEAGAIADYNYPGWQNRDDKTREHFRRISRRVLEAAVPYLIPDREALSVAVYEKSAAVALEGGYITTLIAPEDAVAAVLALLGGAEDCDHSDYVTGDDAKARCGSCGKLMSEVPSDQPS